MRSPLKRVGGKGVLARLLVPVLPPRPWTVYLEPYFGAGSMLFALDGQGYSEVANDVDGRLGEFFAVLRDPALGPGLIRSLELTPYSRAEFESACSGPAFPSPVERARQTFILARQSFSAASERAAWSRPTAARVDGGVTRRGMGSEVSAWLSAVEGLPEAAERLLRVAVECGDGVALIERYDVPGAAFYIDPPYLHSTRTTARLYAAEMDDAAHAKLLAALAAVKHARVMLSGYPSESYASALAGWRTADIDTGNHASGKTVIGLKRRMTERVWMNYPAGGGHNLFGA